MAQHSHRIRLRCWDMAILHPRSVVDFIFTIAQTSATGNSLLSHHPPSCSRAALLVWYSCLVCHFLASLSNVLAPNWPRGPNWLLHANLDSSPISIDLNIRSHLKSNSVLKVERQNSLFLSKLSSYVTRVLPRTLNAPFTVTPELTPSSYPHTDPSWPTILKKSKKLWHNRL